MRFEGRSEDGIQVVAARGRMEEEAATTKEEAAAEAEGPIPEEAVVVVRTCWMNWRL